MRLSKCEQETIVNFNEEEPEASVYTYNTKWKARLRAMAKLYPEDCIFKSKNKEGGVVYQINKNMVSIRQPYSEERKMHDREVALAQGRRPPRDWDDGDANKISADQSDDEAKK